MLTVWRFETMSLPALGWRLKRPIRPEDESSRQQRFDRLERVWSDSGQNHSFAVSKRIGMIGPKEAAPEKITAGFQSAPPPRSVLDRKEPHAAIRQRQICLGHVPHDLRGQLHLLRHRSQSAPQYRIFPGQNAIETVQSQAALGGCSRHTAEVDQAATGCFVLATLLWRLARSVD